MTSYRPNLLSLALLLALPLSVAAAPKAARKAAAKKAPLAVGSGVIVTLQNGSLIEGIYRGDADGAFWVEVEGGEVGIEKATIAKITAAKTGSTEYNDRAAALDSKDAAGWWELSLWAEGKGLHASAESAAKTVVKLNPNHERAREFLGFEKVGERWLRGDEVHAAKGLVQYDGKWLTPEQITAAEKRRKDQEFDDNQALMQKKMHAPMPPQAAPKKPIGGWVDNRRGGN